MHGPCTLDAFITRIGRCSILDETRRRNNPREEKCLLLQLLYLLVQYSGELEVNVWEYIIGIIKGLKHAKKVNGYLLTLNPKLHYSAKPETLNP